MTIDIAQWVAWKSDLVGLTDLDRDALHIYAGVGLQLGIALLIRRGLGTWLPWLAVLLVALAVEVADIYVEFWPSPVMQGGKAVHDIVNTLILPTLLLLYTRYVDTRSGRAAARDPGPVDE